MTKESKRPRQPRPTMTDVARLAGVSQTTVSFVLNGRDDAGISDETKERILSAVQELGYRPNAMAQALRRGQSNLLGLITDKIATTPYAVEIIRGAQDAAQAAGKLLIVLTAEVEEWGQAAEVLIEHQAEGVVCATMYHRQVSPPASLRGIPLVLANCFTTERDLPTVIPDELQGAYSGVSHLIEQGHQHIAFFNNVDDIPAAHLRFQGYRQALEDHQLAYNPRLVCAGESDPVGGYDLMRSLLAQESPLPTALFCFNDRMAMGVYAALTEAGLHVPQDFAVVGFDNQEMISAYLRPPLTTMQLPHYAMGHWSVSTLLDSGRQAKVTRLPCPLVNRLST